MPAVIYMVECGFADPSREAEWNAWYSGAKLDQLLAVPDFLSAQRFRALDAAPAPFLNATTIASPRMFTSRDYRGGGGGGFGPWSAELVIDWTRRLFTGLDDIPAVPMSMRLAVLDAPPGSAPDLGLAFGWLTGLGWQETAGYDDGIALDDSLPHRGLSIVDAATAAGLPAIPGLRLYEPLCPKRTRG